MQLISPPKKPSHVFLGLILGAILCFPNINPEKYAKLSLAIGIEAIVKK
jgi:hypothetical protein